MQKIPNTNLTLSEAEIQAVIAYYLTRNSQFEPECSMSKDEDKTKEATVS